MIQRMLLPILLWMQLAVCAVPATANDGMAPETALVAEDGDIVSKHFSEILGRKVSAEGISGGKGQKGESLSVIVDGGRVKVVVKNDGDARHWDNGRLVRVAGVLKTYTVKAPPPGTPLGQTSGEGTFYYIEAKEWKFLDRAEDPYVRVQR